MSVSDVNPVGRMPDRNDERWQLVERIIASRHFARAPQLRDFLIFVSRRVIFEERQDVGEAEIARKVLGRPADFNTKEDNIVRVQARHLRAKLDAYFDKEGLEEPIVLRIPKRSYLPTFESRTSTTPAAAAPAAARRSHYAVAALILSGLAVAGLFVLWRAPRTNVVPEASNPILGRVFHSGEPTHVILSDNAFSTVQYYLGIDVSLEQYLTPGFVRALSNRTPEQGARNLLEYVAQDSITSIADAAAATRLAQQAARYGSTIVVRSPKDMHARDFLTGNFVTLGGPRGNPWVQLFQEPLNFQGVSEAKERRYWYVNKSPLPGEQKAYGAGYRVGEVSDSYAQIVLLPNAAGNGTFLLMMGQTMDGNEAAEQFVEKAKLPKELSDWLKADNHYAEMLIHVRGVQVAAWSSDLVAFRKMDEQSARPNIRSIERFQPRP